MGAHDPTRPLVLDPVVLLYCGYIGGAWYDKGWGIAVDSVGNAYVTGFTESVQATFPVKAGPDLTFNGYGDAFVAKINPSGTSLLYAGYIGGELNDWGYGIAVDDAGNAYVTGDTDSDEATFPVVGGPDLTFNGGETPSWPRSIQPALPSSMPATSEAQSGTIPAIAVDGAGSAYIAGLTESNEATFPVVVGPDLTFNGGGRDAFVAKVNPAGAALTYAGYIGGVAEDWGVSIALDDAGNAYITGHTGSDQTTFPVTVGPDLTFNGGDYDAFVAQISSSGTALLYAGYIGGEWTDRGHSIAVDAAGNAYVTGVTWSDQATFPVVGGPDLTFNGNWDAFVAKIDPAGATLIYAGYIGGAEGDYGSGIAVDGSGNAYVTGNTSSDQATFPVVGGPDLTFNGGTDAFVTKINPSGGALLYAGYIGGADGSDVGGDQSSGIAVDGAGNTYITGSTDADQATFPAVGGPDLTYNGGTDAFVANVTYFQAPTTLGNPGDENWAAGFQEAGLNGVAVLSLAADGEGNLYAGGWFTMAGPVPANRIARWDITTSMWSALGSGMDESGVHALVVDESGNLYAGGDFRTAGGVPASYIAKWDGASWSALGSGIGLEGNGVYALAVDGSGNLYAGGWFGTAGGVTVNHIAKWDGTTWSALGAGMNATVYALAVGQDGSLYAGGAFSTAGGTAANEVARWDGTAWHPLGNGIGMPGFFSYVSALAFGPDGSLYAGSYRAVSGEAPYAVARWDGTTWRPFSSGMHDNSHVMELTFGSDGSLYAGGQFEIDFSGAEAHNIARWDGTHWNTLGSGTNDAVAALATDRNGSLFAGGWFTTAGSKPSSHIARWIAADGRAVTGPGTYAFYADNFPVTITIPTGGLGDLARINIQRFNRGHPNAPFGPQTGYYWQIEGLDASDASASGYAVDLTLPVSGFTPDEDARVCRYTGAGRSWDCAATSYTTDTITRNGVTQLSDWAVGKRISMLYLPLVLR